MGAPCTSKMSLLLAAILRGSSALIISVLVLGGCGSLLTKTPRATHEGDFLVHVVSPSAAEDIDTILYWYTGTDETRSELEKYNNRVRFDQLQPGQRILIPQALVTQSNPLPRKKISFSSESEPHAPVAPSAGSLHRPRSQDPLEAIIESRGGVTSSRPVRAEVIQEGKALNQGLQGARPLAGAESGRAITSRQKGKKPSEEGSIGQSFDSEIDPEIHHDHVATDRARTPTPKSRPTSPEVFDEIP